MSRSSSILTIIFCLISANLIAQEKGKFGFNFRVFNIQSIGGIYHFSNSLAIRSSLEFDRERQERRPAPLDFETESNRYGLAISLIKYWGKDEGLSLFVGPQFSYSTLDFKFTRNNETSTDNGDEIGVTGLFGAQYKIAKRLGIFAELSFGYSRESIDGDSGGSATTDTWRVSKSGVGFIIYVN